MKLLTKILLVGAASLAACGLVTAAVVGQPAPNFTLTDISGKTHQLSDFKGKTVVLEWVNPECPFVVKHYDRTGNIPKTQSAATSDGVVWLQVNSAHPGAQGDYSPAEVAAWTKKTNAAATAYLRDPEGKVGKLYDARTTPHLYVVNGDGTLVYAGGIDNKATSNVEDISSATNYVTAALADLKAGKPVAVSKSRPYGCGIKYAK
jgi:cytochrome oxidase Cu insertion factor (SCO1/SenC/PrrC family)